VIRVQCHEVKVDGRGDIVPEVLGANIDDVVAWTFERRKQNDVYMLCKDGPGAAGLSDRSGRKGGGRRHGGSFDAKTLAGEVVKARSVIPIGSMGIVALYELNS